MLAEIIKRIEAEPARLQDDAQIETLMRALANVQLLMCTVGATPDAVGIVVAALNGQRPGEPPAPIH